DQASALQPKARRCMNRIGAFDTPCSNIPSPRPTPPHFHPFRANDTGKRAKSACVTQVISRSVKKPPNRYHGSLASFGSFACAMKWGTGRVSPTENPSRNASARGAIFGFGREGSRQRKQ